METGINWQPATLKDALDSGESVDLDYQPSEPGPIKRRYRCECGSFVAPFRLIDLRILSNPPQLWACDGCVTHWRRHLMNVVGAREYDKSPENRRLEDRKWLRDWIASLGAPAQLLAQIDSEIVDLESSL